MDALNLLPPHNLVKESFEPSDLDCHYVGFRKPTIKVASFDGGGTRGIIEACFCQRIEETVKIPFASLCDVFAGTSTGAAIATALNIPQAEEKIPLYSAKKIVEIFKDCSEKIFPYQPWYKMPAQLWGPKYSADGLHSVLNEYCQEFRLKDSLKDILIPAAELNTLKPWWFTKQGVLHSEKKFTQDDIKLVDEVKLIKEPLSQTSLLPLVPAAQGPKEEAPSFFTSMYQWFTPAKSPLVMTAMPLPPLETQPDFFKDVENLKASAVVEASAAAPTYLPEKEITLGGKKYRFMDGGTFANNPSEHAVSYAESLCGRNAPYLMICFGTGYCPTSMLPSFYNQGMLYWGAHFSSATLSLSAENVYDTMRLKFSASGDAQNLYILQPEIKEEDFTLDGSSKKHIERLIEYADTYYEEHDETFLQLCNKLEREHEAENKTQAFEFY